MNIQPKTYNDVLRLSKCFELRKYVNISDEKLEEIYNFLAKNAAHKIGISNNQIYFVNAYGTKTEAGDCQKKGTAFFDQIVMSTQFFKVLNNQNSSSGCGCGGCGSNNNNNNNNNNG